MDKTIGQAKTIKYKGEVYEVIDIKVIDSSGGTIINILAGTVNTVFHKFIDFFANYLEEENKCSIWYNEIPGVSKEMIEKMLVFSEKEERRKWEVLSNENSSTSAERV